MTGGWITRLFVGLWTDRLRFLAAGGIALLLWFLLGEKVNHKDSIPLEVRILAEDEAMAGDGLFIRVPGNLAFTDVDPTSVDLELSGPRAEMSRLEGALNGYFEVPSDFIGEQKADRRVLRVKGDFRFPQLESSRVDIVNQPEIVIGLARREVGSITLRADNLEFQPPTLGEGIEVSFDPSILQLSGPQAQIQKLKVSPELFRLATIGRHELEIGLRGGLTVRPRQGKFLSETLHRLDFALPGADLVRITLRRASEPYVLTFDSVEVTPLVPKGAWREGIRKEDPLGLEPETVRAEVRVPKTAFPTREEARAHVERELNLFVDLGDMPFTTLAQWLKVRAEGLPEGATISVSPDVIDVHWNEAETTEEPK